MPNEVVRTFGEKQRERLEALFRLVGSVNVHERESARGKIGNLLAEYGKTWGDVVHLLAGGKPSLIDPDLTSAIAALGSSDANVRQTARNKIQEYLDRHRKAWADLTNELCAPSSSSWTGQQAPWPPRVNPLALLIVLLERYVELKPHQSVIVALWIIHTHCFDRFTVTPRLALRSPTPECGKTTLMNVQRTTVANPVKFDWITSAKLFRVIDSTRGTMLLDETDNLLELRNKGRLVAVINSGHAKGGRIGIVDGEFETFSPLAMALPDTFGGLSRTTNSRCLTIHMEKARRKLQRFDPNFHPELDAAHEQILLWRRDVQLDLDPPLPAVLAKNRRADNFRPLISIADSLGWGDKARESALILISEFNEADTKIVLLYDVRNVFNTSGLNRLPRDDILAALHALPDADWTEFCGLHGDETPHKLRSGELVSMLGQFKITTRAVWPPNRTAETKSARGYYRSQFEEAWAAYCDAHDDGTQSGNIKLLRGA